MQHTRGSFDCSWLAGTRTVLALATGLGIGSVLLAGAGQSAAAATRCVNPTGAQGCSKTIKEAVNDASPGDTIRVAHGTYMEYVVISKPLSLIGDNRQNTIIDASEQPFGISVNGIGISGLRGVTISGFTVQNANNAGIVVANASDVTITRNIVTGNDKGLLPGEPPTCPTLAGFSDFTGEDEDCGEGIFLSGVDHSTVANNRVTGNAGGILITDDTGATHDNLITGNTVVRNTNGDCGITLPSHSDKGVFHNTISDNNSSQNSGPGVGIFAPVPGSKAYGNVVVNNRLRGNGLPGVTMHNHVAPGMAGFPADAPLPIFDDNVILGNDISANAADTEDAATPGPTGINIYSVVPMTGTLISQNVIHQEDYDIFIKIPGPADTPAVLIHLNDILDNGVGLQNAGAAQVDATQNWWGCNGGPGANGCTTIVAADVLDVLYIPWLTRPFQTREDE
ncbi:MAG TPA: right-handed parallel beta-helix repeat-containing protein [Bryobacteraceae bacterium]|nr:right-handed parallel beta-helix repeat-containing protein [Bryobacteraceae bacterium]